VSLRLAENIAGSERLSQHLGLIKPELLQLRDP
jgi:hypothetical protein